MSATGPATESTAGAGARQDRFGEWVLFSWDPATGEHAVIPP